MTICATQDCLRDAEHVLRAGGVDSSYCHACAERIGVEHFSGVFDGMTREWTEQLEDDVETKGPTIWHYMDAETVACYGPWVRLGDYVALSAQLETERRRSEAIRRALEVIRDYHECRNTLAGAVDLARATLGDTE